jgi:hypothetical protein
MKRRNLALVGRNLAHVTSVADSHGAIRSYLYGGRVSAWVKIPTHTTALFPERTQLVADDTEIGSAGRLRQRTCEQNGVLAILRLVLGAGVTPAAEE